MLGRQFDELPLDWNADAPLPYELILEAERESRARLTGSFCTIDDDEFHIRGSIELPIIGQTERFTWGAWTSLSAASMQTISKAWDRPDRSGHFLGWLCTCLPLYPETLGLKVRVHLRAPPIASFIELEPTDHPLAVEQRQGTRSNASSRWSNLCCRAIDPRLHQFIGFPASNTATSISNVPSGSVAK
jgi:hypothetical protein